MRFKLEKWHMAAIAAILCVSFLIYSVVAATNRSLRATTRCAKSCDEFRSQMIDGKCYCKNDVGWVEPNKVKYIYNLEAKVKEKPKHKKR